jgi:hypothetical protein
MEAGGFFVGSNTLSGTCEKIAIKPNKEIITFVD